MVKLVSSIITGSEDRPIAIDLRYDDQGKDLPVIVFIHGFKGFKDWGHFPKVMEELARLGFAVVSFNLSHNGTTLEHPIDFEDLEAFGHNNYAKELFDTGEVIRCLSIGSLFTDVPINKDAIFLMGHSRGGGISILKTAEDPRVKGLATWNSVGDLTTASIVLKEWKQNGVMNIPNARTNQQMPMYYQFAEDCLANRERYDLKSACSKIGVPTLFIHGTQDTTVPFSHAEELHLWTKGSVLLPIENGGHTFGGKHPFTDDELPRETQLAISATAKHFNTCL